MTILSVPSCGLSFSITSLGKVTKRVLSVVFVVFKTHSPLELQTTALLTVMPFSRTSAADLIRREMYEDGAKDNE